MTYEFLAPDAAVAEAGFTPVARSPMERDARAAGAKFEVRDGWSVATGYSTPDRERRVCAETVGWADASHLGKLELQGSREDLAAVARSVAGVTLAFGRASRVDDAWWCPLTPQRALVVCATAALPALRDRVRQAAEAVPGRVSVVDVTTVFAAMVIAGPQARETFARFCALDLRPQRTPVHALRPGSVARTPGTVIREAGDRYLVLFGWALGAYLWEVVSDAATHLGGAPVAFDALPPIAAVPDKAPQMEEVSGA